MKIGACIWENRCTHLIKQVHLFGQTGAPVLEKGSLNFLSKMLVVSEIIYNFAASNA